MIRGSQGRMKSSGSTVSPAMSTSKVSLPSTIGNAGMRRHTNTEAELRESITPMSSRTGGGPRGGSRVTLRT